MDIFVKGIFIQQPCQRIIFFSFKLLKRVFRTRCLIIRGSRGLGKYPSRQFEGLLLHDGMSICQH